MKLILILAASITLAGCAIGSMPAFPEQIVNHYMVEVRDEPMPEYVVKAVENVEEIPPMHEVVRCIKFDIISKIPYKLKFVSEVPLKDCNGVGGYKPDDSMSLYNWMQDVQKWAEKRKKCFQE